MNLQIREIFPGKQTAQFFWVKQSDSVSTVAIEKIDKPVTSSQIAPFSDDLQIRNFFSENRQRQMGLREEQ